MTMFLALSPMIAVAVGALLLMLAEAFGKPAEGAAGVTEGGVVVDAGAGRSSELALGSSVILLAGAVFAIAVWMVGPENIEGADRFAPYLICDRFSVFWSFVLCLGGA